LASANWRRREPDLAQHGADLATISAFPWAPELAQLTDELMHQEWSALPLELAAAGLEIRKNYPQPIVEHKAGCVRRSLPMQGSQRLI
jgi:deoxyribodipyrimidine photolyase